jgi:cytoskeletal protein CcmA (bactofilin family)
MARTHIGPDTRVAGPLSGKDDLTIEGTVEGPVEGAAEVVIAPGARVGGEVRGRDVVIGGKLEHNVVATGMIRLLSTAEVLADLVAPKIAIDEGAVFEGQVRRVRPPVANATVKSATEIAAPKGRADGAAGGLERVPEQAPRSGAQPGSSQGSKSIIPREIPSLPAVGKRKILRRTP